MSTVTAALRTLLRIIAEEWRATPLYQFVETGRGPDTPRD